jgi:hypothetical protein
MTEIQNSKPIYDLEERTFQFAKAVRLFVKTLPKTIANVEDGRQLIKASGSVGANYIEANESLGKKDFFINSGKIKMIEDLLIFWSMFIGIWYLWFGI